MYLYNTLSRKKEEFKPINQSKITFYHCGPTVYWTQHIGNLRGMMMSDLLVRTLEYLGYRVIHVRNYTDVGHLTGDNLGDADSGEDRMEKGARREGLNPNQIADKYIRIFEEDTRAINLLEPNFKPRPSQLIPEIIKMIQELLDKGLAYITDLGVYFDVTKFANYSQLSKQKLDLNLQGSGQGEVWDKQKIHPADFALWVFKAGKHQNALQTWSSPFMSKLVASGQGFPGWHIECSVMSRQFLGKTIDIHAGGVEHIAIHHTNEIAQSEGANGVKFVNYWFHNEHLVVNEGKMAKSEGTGFALSEVIEKGFHPLALRYFFLQAHYRSRQNFTWEGMAAAEEGLENLSQEIYKVKFKIPYFALRASRGRQITNNKIQNNQYREKFQKAIADDLNIPSGLAVLQEMLKSNLKPEEKISLVLDFDRVLGLKLELILSIEPSQLVRTLVQKREQLRQAKDFSQADLVRAQIEQSDWCLEEGKGPTLIRPKRILKLME